LRPPGSLAAPPPKRPSNAPASIAAAAATNPNTRTPLRLPPTMADSESAPKFAPFIGMAGIAFAMIFGTIGAAYGTAKSGIGISGVGTFRPDLIMKSLIPVVMSGIIAVYSLVIAVLIAGDMAPPPGQHYALFTGFLHLAAGLSVGLTGLAAGVGDEEERWGVGY
ncbi:hypothetical protein V498_04738, partial [Pseudogymnoascus sp. VKM F-4517 (FW-2822)]